MYSYTAGKKKKKQNSEPGLSEQKHEIPSMEGDVMNTS